MKKKLTIFLMLIVAIVSSFAFTACKKTEYKFNSYVISGESYEIGEKLFGVELKKDFVVLKLNDGELELTISEAFLEGDASLEDEYKVYTGTYTETDTTITASIPNFSSKPLTGTKSGKLLTLKISSTVELVLKK